MLGSEGAQVLRDATKAKTARDDTHSIDGSVEGVGDRCHPLTKNWHNSSLQSNSIAAFKIKHRPGLVGTRRLEAKLA